MPDRRSDGGLPLEQFIQALTSQLDRAQTAMALKARAGLPLTFAVKDLTLDLRTHVEMVGSVVQIRPAGPGEPDASTLHLSLTTITRPMIEENTVQLAAVSDEAPVTDALEQELTPEERRRLEWAGVQTISQLVDLQRHATPEAIERIADIPAARLRAALQRAARPFVSQVIRDRVPDLPGRLRGGRLAGQPPSRTPPAAAPAAPADAVAPAEGPAAETPTLRIRGNNLMRDVAPQVRIGGEAVPVIKASPRELVVAPLAHQLGGVLTVETAPGLWCEAELPPDAGAAPDDLRRAPSGDGAGASTARPEGA